MSKITIDKDHNVSYTSRQNFMFDCNMDAFSPYSDLRNMMGKELNSQDYMAVNITASLGTVGDPEPKTQVEKLIWLVLVRLLSDLLVIYKQSKQIVSKIPSSNY